MHFTVKSLFGAVVVAGCSQTTAYVPVSTDVMQTAGVYSSFDAKGGGQVAGDTFVRPPGVENPVIAVADAPSRGGSCWDGSSGVGLGPLTLCPPKPKNIVVISDGSGTIVVSPSNTDDDANDDSNSGGGDDPTTGGGDDPTTGGGDDPTTGGGDDPTTGGGDDPTTGGGDDPTTGGGDDPTTGGGDDPTTGGGDDPTTGGGDDPTDGSTTDDQGGDDSAGGGFTTKYDRLTEVYGTPDWQTLPEPEQERVREYYRDNGGSGTDDWSEYEASDDAGN